MDKEKWPNITGDNIEDLIDAAKQALFDLDDLLLCGDDSLTREILRSALRPFETEDT